MARFQMLPDPLVRLPRFVGFAATMPVDDTSIYVRSFNRAGAFAGSIEFELGQLYLSPDAFVEFYLPDGISAFDTESLASLDHIQFGYDVPEPGTSLLAGVAAAVVAGDRKRAGRRVG